MEHLSRLTIRELKELMNSRSLKIQYPNKDTLVSALYEDIERLGESVEGVLEHLNLGGMHEEIQPDDSASQVSSKMLKAKEQNLKEIEEMENQVLELEQKKRRLLLAVGGLDRKSLIGKDNQEKKRLESTEQHQKDEDSLHAETLQRDKILETLVSFNLKSKIPDPSIEKFTGDLTKYRTFVMTFDHTIASKLSEENEKLFYLDQFTGGKPRDIVRACLHMAPEEGYKEARSLLEKRYGNQERIAAAYVDQVLAWPGIGSDDYESLDEYSILLTSCKNAVSQIPYGISELDNPKTMRRILEKFPMRMKDGWRRKVDNILEAGGRVHFHDMVKFVENEARVSNNPLFGKQLFVLDTGMDSVNNSLKAQPRYKSASINMVNTKMKCWNCTKGHLIDDCMELQNAPQEKKLETLRRMKLCFGCLRTGHLSRLCRSRKECKICHELHPTLLHRVPNSEERNYASLQSNQVEASSNNELKEVCTFSCSHSGRSSHGMTVIPVKVMYLNGRTIKTHAFLDPGSSATFCTNRLLTNLGTNSRAFPNINLTITTMNGCRTEEAAMVTGLTVSDIDGSSFEQLPPVFAVEKIPVEKEEAIKPSCLGQWEHLTGVEIPDLDADVDIMIGANVPRVLEPWDIIHSTQDSSAYAVRTKLGWIVYGAAVLDKLRVSVNRTSASAMGELDRLLVEEYNKDFRDVGVTGLELSQEDKRWLERAQQGCRKVDGKYVVPLPLTNTGLKLPDNYFSVRKRLQGLKKKFSKDASFREEYLQYMNNIIKSGFAELVPDSELDKKPRWYIPHFGVRHPDKPGKTRVVHDCAARFNGVALNDLLSQGPDLNNLLIRVLLKFRQGGYAYTADIEQMFFQVRVPKEDRDYFRFLWWENSNMEEEPEVFRMTVHLFGACSSPSCAIFALKKTVEENSSMFKEDVCSTVLNNFYVDDCLKSGDDEEELALNAVGVRDLCRHGGFNLTKFVSNSNTLLQFISGQCVQDKVCNIIRDPLASSVKTLGIMWEVEEDLLMVSLRISSPATKRELLSVIAGIYDPLGMAAPWILEGRIIVQELCRLKVSWDETLSETFLKKVKIWVSKLDEQGSVTVPRWMVGVPAKECIGLQLHVFSDASTIGYGVVAYIRAASSGGLCLEFVMGKARVCPLKAVTVPRLELTAAVLAVEVYVLLCRSLDLEFQEVLFWTDSTTVLSYIRSETLRFHTFVANRVTRIRESTDVSQWHYVCSEENPADEASRARPSSRWLRGPDFLLKSREYWPKQPVMPDLKIDAEVKKEVVSCQAAVDECGAPTEVFLRYFSSWRRLLRGVAILRRFGLYLQFRFVKRRVISVDELVAAECAIIGYVQRSVYQAEISSLQKQGFVKSGSVLRRLSPILKNGMIRVGGRLKLLDLEYEEKHPIVLPAKHSVSVMVVRYYHERYGHIGTNYLLGEIRRKYWIIKGRSVINATLKKCVVCRRNRGKPIQQQMAPLPADRGEAGRTPFYITGLDCFGPFFVKVGRSQVKRYGVIFTCFSTRAVHLELVYDMSSDAFINVLSRFLARRGGVRKFYCDRGTNFTGAYKEIRNHLEKDNEKISREMVSRGVDWIFHPPGASHFGGVWERMIRTVRQIFTAMLGTQVLTDDSLHTLFCEVESIINGRPLSVVPSCPNDLVPLTPNDLLNIGSRVIRYKILEGGSFVQKRWKQVQYMSQQFWMRWKKEYLLALQERQKWLKVSKNVEPGDVVLVTDEFQQRCHWPLGIVTEVKVSKDGLVRSATIRLMNKLLERPLSKLVMVLEAEESPLSVTK